MSVGVLVGTVSLVIAGALLWLALPNKQGQQPSFLKGALPEVLYPVTILLFLAIGVSQIIANLF